mmetsp:Transcript_17590/g.31559  ORF Transcript_17590/g.31559 Transcript_17590/m.31559 type:complete len:631 (-) Transcript_17590:176-2068(-)|eukprot:CAMPEP_0197528114 /NCGR_PEP_ID=MMETSP1318-20131121/23924_1 /TAXON_ID=552666 /ORGANISM="Partenskyella glossopodia, Strain RCC365" /LENGTH=630 /DNA_ID=CAMNT_0043083069 /DNA_START=120 /DNA_END=2012 /DNA_ORIENTATION=+
MSEGRANKHKRSRKPSNHNIAKALLRRQIRPWKKGRDALQFSGAASHQSVSMHSIVDANEEVKRSVVLAFSVCGNYLLSYRVRRGSVASKYFLEWWVFNFEEPLVKAAEVELFCGLESASSSLDEFFGPDAEHLRIEIAQAPDSSSVVALGYSSDSSTHESRINVLSVVPVPMAMAVGRAPKVPLDQPKRHTSTCEYKEYANSRSFLSLGLSFVSYHPHDVLSESSLVKDVPNGRYFLLINTSTGIHTLNFKISTRAHNHYHNHNHNHNHTETETDMEMHTPPPPATTLAPQPESETSSSVEACRQEQPTQFKTAPQNACFSLGSGSWLVRAVCTLHELLPPESKHTPPAPAAETAGTHTSYTHVRTQHPRGQLAPELENQPISSSSSNGSSSMATSRSVALELKGGLETPREFRGGLGVHLIGHGSVDVERHLLQKVRLNSRKLASPKSLSIHNYTVRIMSAGLFDDEGESAVETFAIDAESPSENSSGKSEDLKGPHRIDVGRESPLSKLRVSCVLLLEMCLRKTPSDEPVILSHAFRIGIDWKLRIIKDLKMRKLNVKLLRHRHRNSQTVMSICEKVARSERVLGWNLEYCSGFSTAMAIASNAAVFRGVSLNCLRHPRLPVALVFS